MRKAPKPETILDQLYTKHQIFHYTRCITPKRLTSWRGSSSRHCASPLVETLLRWRAVGNTVSDLTGPRFEPQTSRSRNKRVTARPVSQLLFSDNYYKVDQMDDEN